MAKIDDLELIKYLEENGRASFVEIAKKFGVTEAAVRKRVKKLMEKGVIERFTVDINPRKLGFNVVACIGVDTEPEALIRVISELKKEEKIKKMYSSAGDHMLMINACFRNHDELESFVKRLESMEGVVKVCPAIILERIK